MNIEDLEDLVTLLEQRESVQMSHEFETKPVISSVTALRVDVNRLMETISTPIHDAQQEAPARQSP